MGEFKPSADFVGNVMRAVAEYEEGVGHWASVLRHHLVRLAVAALGLLGSAFVTAPCH